MDTLPLPPSPNLEQYKKRAKDLVIASKSKHAGAIRAWATEWLETLARLLGVTITPFVQGSFDRAVEAIEKGVRDKLAGRSQLKLAEAQFLIARAHGFKSWREFAKHVEGIACKEPDDYEFEASADAIVNGDLSALESFVRRNPELVRARSARDHRATLLHYVAANGVEDFRQRTPANAVEIARFLLEAGAEVDALANTYGGGNAQTTMNLLVSSTHPAGAGLQVALVETLLDFGAAIDGLDDDGSPLMTALAFGYSDAADALARRGARIDNIIAAAGSGQADLVKSFVTGKNTLRPDVTLVAPEWMKLPNDPKAHIELGFVWACAYGRTEVVEFLLEKGVDPAAKDMYGMTGLHWAAANGPIDVVRLLLERGAPLEMKNPSGQTVLDSTVHFAMQYPEYDDYYAAVVEALLLAGADVSAVKYPTGNKRVDEVLARYGSNRK